MNINSLCIVGFYNDLSLQGVWGTEIDLPIKINPGKVHDMILTSTPGELDSLKWLEVPESSTPGGISVKVFSNSSVTE